MKSYAQTVKDSLLPKNPIKNEKTYASVLKDSISHNDIQPKETDICEICGEEIYSEYFHACIYFNCFICKDTKCPYCEPYFEIQLRYFHDNILICDGFIEYSQQRNIYCTCVHEIFQGNFSLLSDDTDDAFGVAIWVDKKRSLFFRYYHVHFNKFTGQYMRHDYNDDPRPKDWELYSLSLVYYPLLHVSLRNFISKQICCQGHHIRL